jgi:tetrahydromethanopterin S-methyltransferase subunit E
MNEYNMMNNHPILGAITSLVTFVSGIVVMELLQGVISIVAGVLTICLLIIQLRKALKK